MTETTETKPEMWAVHVLGMDDLMPTASRMLAVRNATWLNLALTRSYDRYADPAWPMAYNVPVVWDGTPEGHAEALAAEEKRDARWSDPDAKVIDDLAADMFLRREAVEAGLKEVIGELDYDLAKSLDPDTSEEGIDGWAAQVVLFSHAYRKAL
jgi:hypothetical protein